MWKKMRTFARVKHTAYNARPILLAAVMLMVAVNVVCAQRRAAPDDSIEVSLLTCQPGQKVYSLYGHTAIRYHDLRTGDDWAFNYGVFDVRKPYFVLRFVFGLTDYELGVIPMDIFRKEYTRESRAVWEQVLNMTTDEKLRLKYALAENYEPENRVYRYNYFYDNCTTRARDMIELGFGGKLQYAHQPVAGKNGKSYRELIHDHTALHPWAAFGNDLCLGVKADLPTDWREREFLPEEMMGDMAGAEVSDGGRRWPAVLQTRMVVAGSEQVVEEEFPLPPMACSIMLLVLCVALSVVEWMAGQWLRFLDVALMAAQGVVGVVLTALLFSEHPTTSTNLQVVLFNPLPLAFLYAVARVRATVWWRMSAVLSVLFLLGALVQDYAEGMVVVALCLLLRSALNEHRQRKMKKT